MGREHIGKKVYIGDSVYAEYDGMGIWLTTENGLPDDPSNKIYLEPEVYSALLQFTASLKEKQSDDRN